MFCFGIHEVCLGGRYHYCFSFFPYQRFLKCAHHLYIEVPNVSLLIRMFIEQMLSKCILEVPALNTLLMLESSVVS